MVALSLMPPLDGCTSCAGQKAAARAYQVAAGREDGRHAEAGTALDAQASAQPPGGAAPAEAGARNATPVGTAARPLLAPDLFVQASLAGRASAASDGDHPALRLQALQAYGASSGRGF